MNYIEWALQRGAELWRAREEALKKNAEYEAALSEIETALGVTT